MNIEGRSYHYWFWAMPTMKNVDQQPVNWEHVELRTDKYYNSFQELEKLSVQSGDFVSIYTGTEVLENGFIFSRHLDDKAGVVALLNALRFIHEAGHQLPCTTYLILTGREEIGDGGHAVLSPEVWELVLLTMEFGLALSIRESLE